MKKISILLTNKNKGDKLAMTLDSLLNQIYPNLEILVLDAGYKDEGIPYVKQRQAFYNNLYLYEKKYASISTLRKLGLEKATGDFVLFVLPGDVLNLNAISVLVDCLEQYEADISIGSFFHPYYKHYLENKCFHLKESFDFSQFQRDIFSNAMLTGKLYKKSLFEEIKFKDSYLNESLILFQLLKKINKVVTTEKILFFHKEHATLFENSRFWEDQQSFWYKCQPILKSQEKFLLKNKKQFSIIKEPDFFYLRVLDYLLWELLVYAEQNATIESLTMELHQILKNEFYITFINKIPLEGLIQKKMNEDEFLASCILFSDLLVKKISSLQEKISQINIMKICYMIFIKIFYRQVGSLNIKYYLCNIREELNLNESKEAKFVNHLNL